MKIKTISLFLFLLITGCATGFRKDIPVTLIGNDKELYIGRLDYDNFYSGILTIEVGSNRETFTGRFVVVDRTARSSTQGALVVPQGNQLPVIGSVGSTSSGGIDASGFWYGSGDKGSTMECVLQIGSYGRGHGTCKHSNGREYKILL